MKDFFKYMLATICGIIVVTIIGFLLGALTFMGMLSGGDSKVKAPENSVFVLKLNGQVSERADNVGPLAALISTAGIENMGLDDIMKAIRMARDEENIKGIYIEGGAATFDSPRLSRYATHCSTSRRAANG